MSEYDRLLSQARLARTLADANAVSAQLHATRRLSHGEWQRVAEEVGRARRRAKDYEARLLRERQEREAS